MTNERRSKDHLRRIAQHRAAREATRLADEAFDELLARVAEGSPASARTFLVAEARWLEARAVERHAHPLPCRVPTYDEEPTTQRSARFLPRTG